MRICSPQLGLSPEATLGGEVYDRETLTRMARLGAELEVILPAGLAYPSEERLTVTTVPLRRGYCWYVANPVFVPFIGAVARRRPFDVLRVHSLRFTGVAALVARWLYGLRVPVIAHHHHIDADGWTERVDRRVALASDLVVTGSEFSRGELVSSLGVSPDNVRVTPYGVSEAYSPGPKSQALAHRLDLSGPRMLLYLGSLIPRKNIGVLLRAHADICAQRADVVLVIAGKGPEEAALRAQAKALGIGRQTRFAGAVPEAEKVDWYRLADVFVHPSRREGFGLVAAEAMACGLPIVASRAGALPEVVHEGTTGLLCDPDRPEQFAAACCRLLDEPDLRARMSQAAKERVRRLFLWDHVARALLQVYGECVTTWRR